MRTKYISIKPNHKTDSNKFNMMFSSISEDIADLYKGLIGMRNDVEANNIVIPVNTTSIEAQITSLQSQLDSLAADTTVVTLYDNSFVVFPSPTVKTADPCDYQQDLGEAVLPIASTNIEYHYLDPVTGQRTLIDNIDEYVHSYLTHNRFEPKVDEIYENSHINAVDLGTSKAHVIRARTKNTSIENLTQVYNLDTEGTKSINAIKVYPIPEMSCNINDITLTKRTGALESVKDVNGNVVSFPIANARRKIFRFPSTDITGVSILINTASYTVIDNVGTREFIVGARALALQENTYLNEGYIALKVPVPSGKTEIGKITPVYDGDATDIEITVYTNETEFNELGNSYIMSGNATEIQTIINTPVTSEYIWILHKLTLQDNGTTPILKGSVITWL